jgi:hypothetical protein
LRRVNPSPWGSDIARSPIRFAAGNGLVMTLS